MCLYGDQEVFDYIYDAFQKDYHVDSHDLSMLMALFFVRLEKSKEPTLTP